MGFENRSFFAGPGVLWLLFFLLIAGCSDSTVTDKADNARSPGSQDSHARPALKQDNDAIQTEKMRVVVRNRATGRPVTGVGVRLFYTPLDEPGAYRNLDALTNLDGEAFFDSGKMSRAAVRTEFDLKITEIDSAALDERRFTHEVQTVFEVTGEVIDPRGRGVEGARVVLVKFAPGQALNEGRAPLPGSSLTIDEFQRHFGYDLDGEAVTGADGTFTCEVKTSLPLVAATCKEGLVCPRWMVIAPSPETGGYARAVLPMHQAVPFEITLYDARNRPMPNYPLRLDETFESRAAHSPADKLLLPFTLYMTTDEEGNAVTRLPAGLRFEMEGRFLYDRSGPQEALPDAVRAAPLDPVAAVAGEELKIASLPHAFVRLQGRVINGEGAPVPQATVTLPVNKIQTDAEGRFRLLIPHNDHRRMAYQVQKEGYRFESEWLPPLPEDAMEIVIETVIEPLYPVRIATPPETVKLFLMPHYDVEQRIARFSGPLEPVIDPGALVEGVYEPRTGEFVFNDLQEGTFTLLAQAGTFQFCRIDTLEIELSRPGAVIDLTDRIVFPGFEPGEIAWLEGRVKVPASARPQGIEVTIVRRDLPEVRRWDPRGSAARTGLGWETLSADAEGAFRFNGLVPGEYVVAAMLWEWDVRLDAHQVIRIEAGANAVALEPLTARPQGRFELLVTDRDDRPLPGICFLLLDPLDTPLGPRGSTTYFFYTSGDGKIVIDKIPPGRYSFSLSRFEGRDPLCEMQVEIGTGEKIEAKIALNEGSMEDTQR